MIKEKLLDSAGRVVFSAQLRNTGVRQKEIDYILKAITIKNKLHRIHTDLTKDYGYKGTSSILKATGNLISDIEAIRESEHILEAVNIEDVRRMKPAGYIIKYIFKKKKKLTQVDIITLNTLLSLGIADIKIFKNKPALQETMRLIKSIQKVAFALVQKEERGRGA